MPLRNANALLFFLFSSAPPFYNILCLVLSRWSSWDVIHPVFSLVPYFLDPRVGPFELLIFPFVFHFFLFSASHPLSRSFFSSLYQMVDENRTANSTKSTSINPLNNLPDPNESFLSSTQIVEMTSSSSLDKDRQKAIIPTRHGRNTIDIVMPTDRQNKNIMAGIISQSDALIS